MLDQITPIILTYDEAPNIDRTLAPLRWAREILVVDSGSTDGTVAAAARHPNVRVVTRPFDDHASQWNFALREVGDSAPWVLALDADYVLTSGLVDELSRLQPPPDVVGYRVCFRYCIQGRPLRGSLYPPSIVLFRPAGARYRLDGHTQRLQPAPGSVRSLQSVILHDDRKPFSRWLVSQERYARAEAAKLRNTPWSRLEWADRLRKLPFVAPPLAATHALVARGCALDGRDGLLYAGQRALAELILSLELIAGHDDARDTNG